ncbi:MAG: hypothetical protein RL490_2688, partial [Pseudomonadota bacterium]
MPVKIALAAAVLLSSASLAAQQASTLPTEILFRNVRVFDGSGAPLSA